MRQRRCPQQVERRNDPGSLRFGSPRSRIGLTAPARPERARHVVMPMATRGNTQTNPASVGQPRLCRGRHRSALKCRWQRAACWWSARPEIRRDSLRFAIAMAPI